MQAAELSRLRQHGGTIPLDRYCRTPKDARTAGHVRPLEWEDHFAPVRGRDGQGEIGPLFVKRILNPARLARSGRSHHPPLILFPPYGCNGNFFRVDSDGRVLSLNTDESLANFFASRGRDVYVVHPSYCERIYRRYVERFPGVPYTFPGRASFETLLQRDVPGAIDYVRTLTGADQVDWLGMSMGSILW